MNDQDSLQRAIEGILPTNIIVMTVLQDPASFFETERLKTSEQHVGTLCVDARTAHPSEVMAWVDRYYAALENQYAQEDQTPIDPWLVVLVTPDSSPAQQWTESQQDPSLGIDVVETTDLLTVPEEVYKQKVRDSLTALYLSPPDKGLETEDDPSFEPIEKFIPADELPEWRARLKELQEGGNEI